MQRFFEKRMNIGVIDHVPSVHQRDMITGFRDRPEVIGNGSTRGIELLP